MEIGAKLSEAAPRPTFPNLCLLADRNRIQPGLQEFERALFGNEHEPMWRSHHPALCNRAPPLVVVESLPEVWSGNRSLRALVLTFPTS